MTIKLNSKRHKLLIAGALLLLIGGVSFLIGSLRIKGHSGHSFEQSRERATDEEPGGPKSDTGQVAVSKASADKDLQLAIDRVIDSGGMESARWGVVVTNMSDGRVLYAREAKALFVPASNMKLFTTAVALDLLGADYRWRTSVYSASSPDKDGIIDGDLTLYGRGAPDLTFGANDRESSLGRLAEELYKRGVRRVRGDVVGDESYFRGAPLGDGWMWNDVQWYYGAEVSALSIGGNEVSLTISPGQKPDESGRLKVYPETSFIQTENYTKTVARDTPATIGITRGLSDNSFRVWGDSPLASTGFRVRVAVHQPALFAAEMFRLSLQRRGIVVDGAVRLNRSIGQRENEKFDPHRHTEMAFVTSIALAEIIRIINKESVNLEAELVLRTLGKERGSTVPDSDPRRMAMRGDDEAGLAVIRAWLEGAGIGTKELALHDGSGLSRLNLVTPESIVRLLAAVSQKPQARLFRDSLSIAGRDGTLRNRLKSADGSIFAKTGTLSNINSLSGFVVTSNGQLLAFSIICNNDTSLSRSASIINSISLLLAAHRQ